MFNLQGAERRSQYLRLNPELKSQSKHVLNKTSLEKDFTQDMGLIFASTELLKS